MSDSAVRTYRRDLSAAQAQLSQARATLRAFPGTSPAALCWALQQEVDAGHVPPPRDLLRLQDAVKMLTDARALRSATLQPEAVLSVTVYVYGTPTPGSARDTAHAAHHAAARLSVSPDALLLVDVSPIETAEAIGQRYTFRTRTAHDAPSAPLPA